VIDTQAVNTLLITLGISVGVVIVLAVGFVASAAAWRRYDRKARIRGIERYLAAMAGQRHRVHSS
jgi:H+/Cl- antiporter ClcA